jgi:DNA-binding CsgD family transcriptional regulator
MPPSDAREPPATVLEKLEGPILDGLATIPVAIWIADRLGLIVWMNVAATALLGARRGSHFSRFIASESVAEARERFARKVHGQVDSSIQQLQLNAAAGPVAAEVTSVPIPDGEGVIGVITLIRAAQQTEDRVRREPKPRLTPRQHQVLQLLALGRSTTDIAKELQISEQTVRNHVRFLLAELRVRSRLEAVVVAFRNEWL